MLKNILRLAIILFCCALPASAQFLGYTSPQTVQQNVFNGVIAPATFIVQNVGQSIHYVTYTLSSGGCNFDIRLEASNTNLPGSYFPISTDGTDSNAGGGVGGSGGIFASGYFPFVRVNLVSFSGCAGNMTAAYSGTSTALGPPVGVFTQANNTRFLVAKQQLVSAASNSFFIVPVPFGSTGGTVYVNYSGTATGTATMQVISGPDVDHLTPEHVLNVTLQNIGTPQIFTVPPVFANVIEFVLNCSGSGCGGLIDIYYQFSVTGSTAVPQCDQSVIINTAASGATQLIAAPTTSQTAVHVCSIEISTGTATAVSLQQGTGTNCATNNAQLTGPYHLAVNSPFAQNFPGTGLLAGGANAVCVNLGAGNQVDGIVTYSVY